VHALGKGAVRGLAVRGCRMRRRRLCNLAAVKPDARRHLSSYSIGIVPNVSAFNSSFPPSIAWGPYSEVLKFYSVQPVPRWMSM
jgi:hypothetical protein